MAEIKTNTGSCIAFDIGNVCIAISVERCQEATGIPADRPEWVSLCQNLEWGRISIQDFLAKAEKLAPKGHLPAGGMLEAFNAKILQPIPGMEALLKTLADKGVQPVFFSDISQLHLDCFRQRFSGASEYQGIYSFEIGAWKPSPSMFAAFEERYGTPLLYVDDRQELIDAALSHGWKNSICFKGTKSLEQNISRLIGTMLK
ncbi:MAG: hypothetical protein IJS08_01360 [Victivallales bacterium]|nr:hypothetical protein [Victivallales bacterium]